eukprot:978994-Rhodomonas_salina.1
MDGEGGVNEGKKRGEKGEGGKGGRRREEKERHKAMTQGTAASCLISTSPSYKILALLSATIIEYFQIPERDRWVLSSPDRETVPENRHRGRRESEEDEDRSRANLGSICGLGRPGNALLARLVTL